jgi:hypothetical protein
MSQRISPLLVGSWGLLGFYRGTQYYNFCHEEDIKRYLKEPNIYKEKPQDFYIYKVSCGGLAAGAYLLPLFCIFPAIKELKRLEINLRGLEEEKKKPEYYSII